MMMILARNGAFYGYGDNKTLNMKPRSCWKSNPAVIVAIQTKRALHIVTPSRGRYLVLLNDFGDFRVARYYADGT